MSSSMNGQNSFSAGTSVLETSSSTTMNSFGNACSSGLCSNSTRSAIANSNMNGELQLVSTLRSTHAQMKQSISIDFLSACQREVNFLRMIDRKAPCLYQKNVVENAIRRYETFWLPMQKAKPDLNNIPPLDVHWVWHTHMLSPQHYNEV